MSLSVLYTLLSPDRDEAGSVHPVRAHPHVTVIGSYYLWSHLAEAEAKPESSFNKWQHLCALGQIIPLQWAAVLSSIKLELQYPLYALDGIVENIKESHRRNITS